MFEPDALQKYIHDNHQPMVDALTDIVERLESSTVKNTKVYDTGLWVNGKSHYTIIYTRAIQSLEFCWFEIKAHGFLAKKLKESIWKGSTSPEYNFHELRHVLEKLEKNIVAEKKESAQ